MGSVGRALARWRVALDAGFAAYGSGACAAPGQASRGSAGRLRGGQTRRRSRDRRGRDSGGGRHSLAGKSPRKAARHTTAGGTRRRTPGRARPCGQWPRGTERPRRVPGPGRGSRPDGGPPGNGAGPRRRPLHGHDRARPCWRGPYRGFCHLWTTTKREWRRSSPQCLARNRSQAWCGHDRFDRLITPFLMRRWSAEAPIFRRAR